MSATAPTRYASIANPAFDPRAPQDLLKLSFDESVKALEDRLGSEQVAAIMAGQSPESPVAKEPSSQWLQRAKVAAVMPRVCGTYWGIVKYALGLPEDAIHILPFFEGGNQGNGYAKVNYRANRDFLDPDLARLGFHTPEQQLKLVVDVLHGLGKAVGMDVTLHTDRFSELVFARPELFEWLVLDPKTHRAQPVEDFNTLPARVRQTLAAKLATLGDAHGQPLPPDQLKRYSEGHTTEEEAERMLFGDGPDKRLLRRIELINTLRDAGLQPAPVIGTPPYRPVQIKEAVQGEDGGWWPVWTVPGIEKHKFVDIFGDLTPFKQYRTRPDGTPDLDHPEEGNWQFVANKLAKMKQHFGFDFMRVDVAHIQIGQFPNGTGKSFPAHLPREMIAYVKGEIQRQANAPYFGSFAESFYAHTFPGVNPEEDLERKHMDTALGFMHIIPVDHEYHTKVREWNQHTSPVRPANTLFTADADNPTYTHLFGPKDLQVKAFASYFLNQPSYTSIGIEQRNHGETRHTHTTEPYIKRQATPYHWGESREFFNTLTNIRQAYSHLRQVIQRQALCWINTPPSKRLLAWTYHEPHTERPTHVLVLNTDPKRPQKDLTLNVPGLANQSPSLQLKFSTQGGWLDVLTTPPQQLFENAHPVHNGIAHLPDLQPAEGRIYQVV